MQIVFVIVFVIILVRTVNLYTRSVVGEQVEVGMYAIILCQEHIVVIVQSEYLITYGRVLGHQVQLYAVLLHCCLCPQAQSHLVLVVKESHASHYAVLQQFAIDEGIKHIVVRWPILYVSPVVYLHGVVSRTYADSHCVEFIALCVQTVYLGIGEYAVFARGLHVNIYERVIYPIVFHHLIDRVVPSALHLQFHLWQEVTQSLLVYCPCLKLLLQSRLHAVCASHQPFVSSLSIQLHGEVATAYLCCCGVSSGEHIECHIAQVVGCHAVSHLYVSHHSLHLIVLVHIGRYIHLSVECHSQRHIGKPQPV